MAVEKIYHNNQWVFAGVGSSNVLRYDVAQSLTDAQKAQAYSNLGAEQATEIPISTAISSSSTNQQVASAKAVYDFNGKQFELIETVTLTESISAFIRSTTPSGEAYNFAKILVSVASANASGGNITLTINGDTKNRAGYILQNNNIYGVGIADVSSGIMQSCAYSSPYSTTPSNMQTAYSSSLTPISSITQIALQFGSSVTLDSGTTIKIYGVWA